MDLFLATLQVVPMLFISLFLDRDTEREQQSSRLRVFHILVAVLGLVAFSVSVYVVGSDTTPTAWMRGVVTTALACAMGALSVQILLRLTGGRQERVRGSRRR